MRNRPLLNVPVVTAALVAFGTPLAAQTPDPELYQALQWRQIGPDGNRTIAVMGEPGNPRVMYVGAASGGIWKTTDLGTSWRPILDDTDVHSVSALAMAPSDPNVLWAGTGETFIIRPALGMGDGIYKSTDAGGSWTRMGLEATGRIGRIEIDPRDPDVVYACALGHAYGPQPERGVYKTTDGGETWKLVLHVSDDAGCIDLAMDASNPRILFASFWDVQIDTWMLDSGGPGSGVWRSKDGGETWQELSYAGRGLPDDENSTMGKVAVAVAPSNPDRVYVLAEESSAGFYRSDDGGDSWRLVLRNHTIAERAPYYTRFGVDPDDENRVYFVSVRFSMSLDGGGSLVDDPPPGGGDTHDVWIDPTDADRIMVADDGGATFSLNRGKTFQRINLPVAQMYHVAVDDSIPYNVYGNRQDGYSYRGPSNSLQGFIPLGLWQDVGGCESGWAQPEPNHQDIVWSGCYDGGIEVYDVRTQRARNVRPWPEAGYGWEPRDLKYRWHWNIPLLISTHDDAVYVGSQRVHRTTDRGRSWQVVSPDLTLNTRSHQGSSGGVATDNLMTFDGAVLFALDESPLRQGLLWAGSNDGQVQLTRDGGGSWTNVTANIPDLPPWGTVTSIEASRFDEGRAYVSIDLHQQADFDPYIYRTTDYGRSWRRIDAGIPRSVHSFVHVVQEDPERPGMLYAGTDNQVWVSLDDGEHWRSLRSNMPPAPVYWLTVQERFDDLVIATYGRGFWILDDLGPLRALNADVMASDAHLFQPREAWRFISVRGIKTGPSHIAGQNPPYGASLNYWLGAERDDGVRLIVEDSTGETVRELEGPGRRGINRVWWDLRRPDVKEPSLRTPPPGRDWVPLGQDGSRPLVTWDLDVWQGRLGARVVPGTYTVRLIAGDREQTATLEVRKDPHTEGDLDDIRSQVAMTREIHGQLNEISAMIDRLEWARRQLDNVRGALEDTGEASGAGGASGVGGPPADSVLAEARRVKEAALAVEGMLFDVNLTGAREDAFRNPMKLWGRFSALASDVAASSSDFAPTEQQKEVHGVLSGRLDEARRRYRAFFADELDALNEMLRQRKVPAVISSQDQARTRGSPEGAVRGSTL